MDVAVEWWKKSAPLRRRLARSAAAALPAAALIVFLTWPIVFTSSGMGEDWTNHLWNIWRQSLTIAHDHRPSLFLNFSESVFYPLYAFYGGTIYALAGALAVLLGNAPVAAYVLTYLIGFSAAYGGWYWLGRMAGLGRWAAQVPGLLFITSGYYLTLIYARGDWVEFIAVSMLTPLVASGLSVLRARRLEILPALALACSALVFFGSHSITLLWGVTAIALLGVAITAAVPAARRSITAPGVIRVALVAVPAALVNAWYLIPGLAYVSRTSVANVYDYSQELHVWSFLLSDANLFTPWRTLTVGTPDVVFALPVATMVWVLVGIAISLRHGSECAWRRLLWIVSGFSVLFGVVMTHPGLILDLPRPYTFVQFGFRLETYVLLGLSAAVLAVLVLARRWPQRLRSGAYATAAVVLIAAGVGAVRQVDGYPQGTGYPREVVADRYEAFKPNGAPPPTDVGLGCVSGIGCGYDDNTLPVWQSENLPEIAFPSAAIHNDRLTVRVHRSEGGFVRTNLAGAPYFVKVTGAKVFGRDVLGHMVLYIEPARSSISLGPSDTLPLVLGRVITSAALAVLAALLLVGLVRRLPIRSARSGSQT